MINLENFDKELDKLFEGIENIEEHHIETRDARVSFILNNSDIYSELDLVKMSDDEIKDIYFPLCDEIFGDGSEVENFEDNENPTEIQDTGMTSNNNQIGDEIENTLDIEDDMDDDVNKNLQEEKQPDAITQLNRIKDINKENALGYFKTLNKGIQKMVDGEEGSEIEYDFDKNDGEVVNPNNKYNYAKEKNDEYLEKAHRGLEDIKLDVPNKIFDDRMKKTMDVENNPLGKQMYDNKEKRNKFIDDNELKNTPMPGRMTISNKVPMKESLSGFYFDKFKNRKVVTFLLENVETIDSISENLRKIETQGVGNKSLNENINNEMFSNDFYIDVDNNKFYKITKEKKKIKISESYLKRMNVLTNYNSSDAVNTSKNINRKLI